MVIWNEERKERNLGAIKINLGVILSKMNASKHTCEVMLED